MAPTDYCHIWDGDTCQGAGGGGSGTCTAPTVQTSPGDSCGFFTGLECDTGMLCNMDEGTCQTLVALDGDCSSTTSTCEFFQNCIDDTCQWGEYTGMCPAP